MRYQLTEFKNPTGRSFTMLRQTERESGLVIPTTIASAQVALPQFMEFGTPAGLVVPSTNEINHFLTEHYQTHQFNPHQLELDECFEAPTIRKLTQTACERIIRCSEQGYSDFRIQYDEAISDDERSALKAMTETLQGIRQNPSGSDDVPTGLYL